MTNPSRDRFCGGRHGLYPDQLLISGVQVLDLAGQLIGQRLGHRSRLLRVRKGYRDRDDLVRDGDRCRTRHFRGRHPRHLGSHPVSHFDLLSEHLVERHLRADHGCDVLRILGGPNRGRHQDNHSRGGAVDRACRVTDDPPACQAHYGGGRDHQPGPHQGAREIAQVHVTPGTSRFVRRNYNDDRYKRSRRLPTVRGTS